MADETSFIPRTIFSWKNLLLVALLFGASVAVVLVQADRSDPRVSAREAERLTPPLEGPSASSLVIPVTFDLADAVGQIESKLPRTFGNLSAEREHPANENLHYAFEAERDPLRISVDDGTVHARTTIHYRGMLSYDTSFGQLARATCGMNGPASNAPAARVHLSSPVRLGPNATLHTDVELERVEPVEGTGRCVLSAQGLRFDATDIVIGLVRSWLRTEVASLNQEFSRVPLRPHMKRAWTALQQPVSLGARRWLVLHPSAVRHGRIHAGRSNDPVLQLTLGVDVTPRITLGPEPTVSTSRLPPFEPFPQPDSVSTDGPSSITVSGRFDYASLSPLVRDRLRTKDLDLLGQSAQIQSVQLSGLGNGRAVAELELRGGVRGTAVAVGTPMYDAEQNTVTVPDLDFTIETRDLSTRVTTWFFRNFRRDQVRRQMTWSVQSLWPQRTDTSRVIDVGLFGPFRLHGRVGPTTLGGVEARDSSLAVRLQTHADLEIRNRDEYEVDTTTGEGGLRDR